MVSPYMLRRQEREERMRAERAVNVVIERKQAINEFEFMRNMAEARAISKFSLENPLSDEQHNRFMELGKTLGVRL